MLLRIRELRLAAGLTQKQLADKMGVSEPAVSFWESDSQRPAIDKLPKLAKILHTSIDDLFSAGDNTIVPEKKEVVHGQ